MVDLQVALEEADFNAVESSILAVKSLQEDGIVALKGAEMETHIQTGMFGEMDASHSAKGAFTILKQAKNN